MANRSAKLGLLFAALADPTRRAVVERLAAGPVVATELARPFRMALPSFLQHMAVLERCGLVGSRKAGRVRTYELAPESLKDAEDWLATQRLFWARRLDRLDSHLENLKDAPE